MGVILETPLVPKAYKFAVAKFEIWAVETAENARTETAQAAENKEQAKWRNQET